VTDQRTCLSSRVSRTGFDLEPSPYPRLFSEYALGALRLRNRVVMMATVNNLGRNDLVTPSQIAFYEARARAELAR